MKILLISSFYPYPLFSGGQVRLYNLLRNLGKKHQITLIAEVRNKLSENEFYEINKYCSKVITVVRPKQWSITNILKTGFSFLPFLLVGHKNSKMRELIKGELKTGEYSLIHVETFYVMQNLPQTSLPIVLVEHNIEYQIYLDWINKPWFIFIKPLLYLDILKLKYWEEYYWKKAKLVAAVSESEKQLIENITQKNVEVVANGVDCEYFSEIKKEEPRVRTVVFVGSFRWLQNRDAVFYLLAKIWPSLKEKFGPEIKLWIVGNDVNKILCNNKDNQIIIDESVSDIRKVYTKATLLLAPIRIGGGTKFKILESMACGLPIVTTPEGIEGIGSKLSGIKVGKNTDEIINETIELLSDMTKRKEMEKQEKIFVNKYFNWKDISEKLEKIYTSLVN